MVHPGSCQVRTGKEEKNEKNTFKKLKSSLYGEEHWSVDLPHNSNHKAHIMILGKPRDSYHLANSTAPDQGWCKHLTNIVIQVPEGYHDSLGIPRRPAGILQEGQVFVAQVMLVEGFTLGHALSAKPIQVLGPLAPTRKIQGVNFFERCDGRVCQADSCSTIVHNQL